MVEERKAEMGVGIPETLEGDDGRRAAFRFWET